MTKYDHTDYCRKLAINVKKIGHTSDSMHFSRGSSIANLEEFLAANGVDQSPHLICIDGKDGSFEDQNSDNVVDRQFYSFGIFIHAPYNEFDSIDQAMKDCKDIFRIVMKKMFHDKRKGKNGLRDLIGNSISYQTITPIGDSFHGILISFAIKELPGFNQIDLVDELISDF